MMLAFAYKKLPIWCKSYLQCAMPLENELCCGSTKARKKNKLGAKQHNTRPCTRTGKEEKRSR